MATFLVTVTDKFGLPEGPSRQLTALRVFTENWGIKDMKEKLGRLKGHVGVAHGTMFPWAYGKDYYHDPRFPRWS